jgi:predicted ATPase
MRIAGMDLLEREGFLGEIDAALNDVASGTGRTVLVAGEAGIGKTALVEHFAAGYREKALVLWGEPRRLNCRDTRRRRG